MIGQTVSHYRIAGQLGAGGMGVVYAAEDSRLGRSVAIKFVPEELAKDHLAVERLRSEARTASNLNHSNICTIYDVGEHEGRPFIVMELLSGQTLRERLAAGPMKIHQVVDIGIQVADALDSAHHRGVIHRDIKPANLFLVDRGPVKILDFGLAKLVMRPTLGTTTTAGPTRDLTAEGVTLGTVAYMSPEQVTGEDLDGRTDLFSLGVVLYECLTGHQPFTGKTSAVIFAAILNRAPVAPVVFNPDLPPRLQEVVNNCLEKDRELRYPDAAALRADLKRVKRDLESGHSGVVRTAMPSSSATISGRQRSGVIDDGFDTERRDSSMRSTAVTTSRRWIVGAAIAAAAVIGAAATMTTSYLRSSRREAPPPPPAVAREAPEPNVRSRVAAAATSLEGRDYRTARATAEEVLRIEPGNTEAIRIRDAAVGMLDRYDDAIARARERLDRGDNEGASSALSVARGIDASSRDVVDLSARLVTALQTQAEAARREAQRGRSVPHSPPPRSAANQPEQPASPAPTPAPRTVEPAPPPPKPQPEPAAPVQSAPVPSPAVNPPAPSPPSAGSTGSAAPAPKPVPPPEPAPSQPAPSVTPAPAPVPPPERRDPPPAPARPTESDDAAIRRIVNTYARAIETKDLALFRTVKPNISPAEQRRIEEGFRAVTSQQVAVTILSIEHHGQEASVRIRRRDTIQGSGRPQTTDSQQTMILTRSGSGWVIREIGR